MNLWKEIKVIILLLGIVAFIASFGFSVYTMTELDKSIGNKIEEQHKREMNMEKSIQEYNEKMKKIEEEQEKINRDFNNMKDEIKKSSHVEGRLKISNLRNISFDGSTDLKDQVDITATQMNQLIDEWNKHTDCSEFVGKGAAFIKAANETGYNPIYLFAHAATESTWGRSHYAINRCNYYGINAVDTNPDKASYMGDDMESGIINGAVWIDKNFYKNNYVNLNQMKVGNYSTSDKWVSTITQIVNTSYQFLSDINDRNMRECNL